ncbi:MAG: 23S rRNA (guanosine(2251)-2'-O)-methyltransferase RlmB [Leptospirales bacterium]|nr:23S rRNA (guanosine(2251)-2'-O)-methyltransferase RlmB [Leptospirales bacterium]
MEKKGIVAGRNPVLEYLRSQGHSFLNVAIAESAHGKIINEIISAANSRKVRIDRMGRDFFKDFGPSSTHQGVVLFLAPGHGSVPRTAPRSEKTLIETAINQKGVLVLLDQINDPHNAGAIIRTAEGLGCCGIVMTSSNSVDITPALVKASAGATAHIPVHKITNAASFMREAKNAGIWIIGTSDKGDAPPVSLSKYRPALVIIGNESSGMRRLTSEMCDVTAAIPLKGQTGSLNASVAAGIILYEILKEA